ncbi:group-specific protein [Psychrobacillus sp.]|uniref:group-specific protein n=1 Tax=Psychrobacillus sp. TaxID=1871623 RepID=UPI0028BDFDE4|nr:group-specific protein [Psychrobacillus sp.]
MLSLQVNESELELMFREELSKKLKEIEHRHTFWDMDELMRQTNMSLPFIKEKFFYNENFPKFKVGRKWLFPAKETEEFLLNWLKQQARN